MDMLQDIYDVVVDTNSKVEGVLIQKTGQTTCYDTDGNTIECEGTGQDGEYQYGALWPDPRFTDNLDGTVTDNLTGLIWLQNANCFGQIYWAPALIGCNTLNSGECGLTDGSLEGDWRLPNVRELYSLIDLSKDEPALPFPHPFTGVQSNDYWSNTTQIYTGGDTAWRVGMHNGFVTFYDKENSHYVWPVRGGN